MGVISLRLANGAPIFRATYWLTFDTSGDIQVHIVQPNHLMLLVSRPAWLGRKVSFRKAIRWTPRHRRKFDSDVAQACVSIPYAREQGNRNGQQEPLTGIREKAPKGGHMLERVTLTSNILPVSQRTPTYPGVHAGESIFGLGSRE
jgi:hypothetical protein